MVNLTYTTANKTYVFQLSSGVDVDAASAGNFTRCINHADVPGDANCSMRIVRCRRQSHIVLVANRSIVAGDELLYQYRMTGSVPHALAEARFADPASTKAPNATLAAVLSTIFPQ